MDNPEGQECLKILVGHGGWVTRVVPLLDECLASCAEDNTLKIWDLKKPEGQECVRTFVGHDDVVEGVIQLRDGRLVSWTDRGMKVWDILPWLIRPKADPFF